MLKENEGQQVFGLKTEEVHSDENQGLLRLQKLRELNADSSWENKDLYRLMFRVDLYITAYERLKSSPGNMTKGSDGETLDGFSLEKIEKIIESMRDQSFQFVPAKRIYIPKANGKKRPLGIPSPKDKIVQEVIRMILESIYDGSSNASSFSDASHGFRAGRGTHSCLNEVRKWHSVNWYVEGDIRGCFDNVNHQMLIDILSKRIKDNRFLDLIWKALRAGYMEKRTFKNSLIGTPQGSVISPILTNIYLNEFDSWVQAFKEIYERGQRKRVNPQYTKIIKERKRIKTGKKEASLETRRDLEKAMFNTPSLLHNDPDYIRIHYIRYADDWLVAIDGPKELAQKFKDEATLFFSNNLLMELSEEKTHIRNARTDKALFLGTEITIGNGAEPVYRKMKMPGTNTVARRRVPTDNITYMYAPESIINRLRSGDFIDGNKNPIAKNAWIDKADWEIVGRYNDILRGYRNYYSFIDNPLRLKFLQYLLQYSCGKTLCRKHQTSLRKLFAKYGPNLKVPCKWDTEGKPVKYISLDLQKSWNKNRFGFKSGHGPTDRMKEGMNLRTRTKLDEPCVICGKPDGVEMHHVKHLRKDKAKGFTHVLQQINRKQIPVCKSCHLDIHNGKHDGKSLSDLYHPGIAAR